MLVLGDGKTPFTTAACAVSGLPSWSLIVSIDPLQQMGAAAAAAAAGSGTAAAGVGAAAVGAAWKNGAVGRLWWRCGR